MRGGEASLALLPSQEPSLENDRRARAHDNRADRNVSFAPTKRLLRTVLSKFACQPRGEVGAARGGRALAVDDAPGKLARETGQYRLQKYHEQDRCYEQDGEPYVDTSADFFIAKHVAQPVPRVKPCRIDDAQNRETDENL